MNSEKILNFIIMILVFGLFFSVWGACICLWIVQYMRKVRLAKTKLGIDNQIKKDESSILRLWCDRHRDDKPIETTKKTTLSARVKKMKDQAG